MSLLSSLWIAILLALAAYPFLCVVVAGAKALVKILDNWIIRRDTRHG